MSKITKVVGLWIEMKRREVWKVREDNYKRTWEIEIGIDRGWASLRERKNEARRRAKKKLRQGLFFIIIIRVGPQEKLGSEAVVLGCVLYVDFILPFTILFFSAVNSKHSKEWM